MAAVALCAAGCANAGSIYDPANGLTWSFVAGANEPLSFATQRTDGLTLGTASQLTTLFSDILGTTTSGTFPYTPQPPNLPAGFVELFYAGLPGENFGAQSELVELAAAPANGASGYVTVADLEMGVSESEYFYGASISSAPALFAPSAAPFAFALVSEVPEPASWALMGIGLLFVAHRKLKTI